MATEDDNDALLSTRVQFLDDTDIFSSSNFPEPTRPPTYTIPRYRNGLKFLNISTELKIAVFFTIYSLHKVHCQNVLPEFTDY